MCHTSQTLVTPLWSDSTRIVQSREVGDMFEMFQRTSLIGALAFGFILTAAWTALIGYGLFRLAELAFQWSI
jgi:hypothetical protein